MRFSGQIFPFILTILLLLIIPVRMYALTPPWYDVTLNLGSTSNVLLDSTSSASEYAGLKANVEKPLFSALLLYYFGDLNVYTQQSEFASMGNEGGLDYSLALGKHGDIWVNGGYSLLNYGDDYSLYDRNKLFIISGINMSETDNVIWRLNASFSSVEYPSYNDTLTINHNDQNYSAGFNISFPGPVAFDLEAGMNNRDYKDLQRDVSTSNTYFNFRVSGPINKKTGYNLQLWLRDEKPASREEKIVLYINGIDPRDLLWDGYRFSGKLTRYFYPWKMWIEYSNGKADYINVRIQNNYSHREDTYSNIDIDLSRPLKTGTYPFTMNFGFHYSFWDNNSNVSFYDYVSQKLNVYLTISSL